MCFDGEEKKLNLFLPQCIYTKRNSTETGQKQDRNSTETGQKLHGNRRRKKIEFVFAASPYTNRNKMPFYDANTAADNINGSFNIFYIIKYLEEMIMIEEHEDELPFTFDEMKLFKNMKKTEGGYLYALTQEFEDDFYSRGTTITGRGKIYDGTIKDMMMNECGWVDYDSFFQHNRVQEKCPCFSCEEGRQEFARSSFEFELGHTDLCYAAEFNEAAKYEENLIKTILPLQKKIKEMLNSPHNRRGRAFIEKQINWAFE